MVGKDEIPLLCSQRARIVQCLPQPCLIAERIESDQRLPEPLECFTVLAALAAELAVSSLTPRDRR